MVCQGGFIHKITEVTKLASKSFDQERPEHPVSPLYNAIAPPPSTCQPGSSILIEGCSHPENLKQAHDVAKDVAVIDVTGNFSGKGKGKEFIMMKGCQRKHIFCLLICTDC